MTEKVAFPNALKYAFFEDLHSYSSLLIYYSVCENPKLVIPAKQYQPHNPCIVPNQEKQKDFAGSLYNEKEQEIYFLTCIETFSKYQSAKNFEIANAPNVIKFLDDCEQLHGVPRSLRNEQACCLIGNQVKIFCIENCVNLISAPANYYRQLVY